MAVDGPPVIIQASINGAGLHRGGHFPASPADIARVALDCFERGAAIVHNHIDRIRCSTEEAVDRYLEAWRSIVQRRADALLFPTAHLDGAEGRPSLEHIGPLARSGLLKLSFCDVGSPNFFEELREGLPYGRQVYANSLSEVARRLDNHARLSLGTILNVYDIVGLRHFLLLHRAGKAPAGCMINLYLATDPQSGREPSFVGLPVSERVLDLGLEMLTGTNLPWTVTVFGGDLVGSKLAHSVLARGGHLTVGLECFGGERSPSNQELVAEAVELCWRHGRRPATCHEAAQILRLPSAS